MGISLASTLAKLLPSVEKEGNLVRASWDRLHGLPGGRQIFSRLLGSVAPYSGSIGARVVELGTGRSRVVLEDRHEVRNHLRCIHAIALANLAEMTGNVAVAYSLPDDARFIVSGMSIEYLAKARGTITASCDCTVPRDNARREILIPVSLVDSSGSEVARATLRTLVGPKKDLHGSA